MGFLDKIKNWFRRLTTGEEEVAEVKLDQPAKTEVDHLMDEHNALTNEREQIRIVLADIDEKYNMGSEKRVNS